MANESRELLYIPPRSADKKYTGAMDMQCAEALGLSFGKGSANKLMEAYHAMDSATAGTLTATIPNLAQFMQNWLPGNVNVLFAKRKIDELVGISTMGDFEHEEIVQKIVENTGVAVPYGDNTKVPFGNWNVAFEHRTIVRFEQGFKVGLLEEARAAKIQVNAADEKRKASMIQLDIQRNLVGFNGYNSGDNRTYGLLNDPGLGAYTNVAAGAGAGSPLVWSRKTFLEIKTDLLTAFVALRTQSQDNIEPNKTPITVAVGTNAVDYLATVSDFGISVWDWLKTNYPNVRVVSAPQLNTANGGVGVMYVYAENVDDGSSTDDGRTFTQVVPARFRVLGVQRLLKGYEEDFAMATAGTMCKRPFAVVRYSGIS